MPQGEENLTQNSISLPAHLPAACLAPALLTALKLLWVFWIFSVLETAERRPPKTCRPLSHADRPTCRGRLGRGRNRGRGRSRGRGRGRSNLYNRVAGNVLHGQIQVGGRIGLQRDYHGNIIVCSQYDKGNQLLDTNKLFIHTNK